MWNGTFFYCLELLAKAQSWGELITSTLTVIFKAEFKALSHNIYCRAKRKIGKEPSYPHYHQEQSMKAFLRQGYIKSIYRGIGAFWPKLWCLMLEPTTVVWPTKATVIPHYCWPCHLPLRRLQGTHDGYFFFSPMNHNTTDRIIFPKSVLSWPFHCFPTVPNNTPASAGPGRFLQFFSKG